MKEVEIKISIIVPVYNAEKCLKRCVDSILNQTLEEIEVILVNDGSKDNSNKICDEYAERDKRVKVIHQKNQGCSKARNVGILASKGKYIGFVDSDDYIEKKMYERMYGIAKGNEADIVETGIKIVFKGKITNIFCNKKMWAGVVNKIFKREFIMKEKIKFPINNSVGEDLVFVTKSEILTNKIEKTKETDYYYEQLETGLTQNLEKRFDIFDSLDEILNFLGESLENKQKVDIEEMIYLHGFVCPFGIVVTKKGIYKNTKKLLSKIRCYKEYLGLKTKIKMVFMMLAIYAKSLARKILKIFKINIK